MFIIGIREENIASSSMMSYWSESGTEKYQENNIEYLNSQLIILKKKIQQLEYENQQLKLISLQDTITSSHGVIDLDNKEYMDDMINELDDNDNDNNNVITKDDEITFDDDM
jgi:hypothetical protein